MESNIAKLSIVFAAIHFAAETAWHLYFGQFLPMLIVDYIAVSLLLYGSVMTLSNTRLVGLLCGAWGFEFCLNYRALFGRVEKLLSGVGHGNPAIDITAYVLAGLMLISVTMFLLTMVVCHRQVRHSGT